MMNKWPYGEETEIEMLCVLFKDHNLLSWVAPKLSPEDFNNQVLGEMWHAMRQLYFKYKEPLTFRPLVTELKEMIEKDVFFPEDRPVIKDALKMLKSHVPMAKWTKARIEKWLADRAYNTFVAKATDAVSKGDKVSIDQAYRKLLVDSRIDPDLNKGDFFERLNEVAEYSQNVRKNFISTGIKEIDYILSGGLARNEFGLVFGVDGLGKSFVLNQFGLAAIVAGYKVLHITNELPSDRVEVRYLSGFTSIPEDQFGFRFEEITRLQETLSDFRGKLVVKFLPPGDSPDTVWAILEEAKSNKDPFDLVLIDYLDRFTVNPKKEKWEDLISVCDLFSFIAKPFHDGGFNCCVVAVTHADAKAYGKQYIGPGNMGLSKIGKNKTVDFVLAIAANKDDQEKRIVRLTTTKLRYRPPAKKNRAVLQCAFETSTFIPIDLETVTVDE